MRPLIPLVETAFEIIGTAPLTTTNDELRALLLARGFAPDDAELLLLFLPVAFGRALLRTRVGVTSFSDKALVAHPDGQWSSILLSEQPIYAAAASLADAAGDRADTRAVAARSAEVAAALEAGKPGRVGAPLFRGLERRLFV